MSKTSRVRQTNSKLNKKSTKKQVKEIDPTKIKKRTHIDGFRKTPMTNILRNYANTNRNRVFIGSDRKYMLKNSARIQAQTAIETQIVEISMIMDLLMKSFNYNTANLFLWQLASLLYEKRPNQWTQEDMLNIKLSKNGKTTHDTLEYTDDQDLLEDKNWKKRLNENEVFDSLSKLNQDIDNCYEYISNQNEEEVRIRPSAFLSGLTPESKNHEIQPFYNNRTIQSQSAKQYRKKRNLAKNIAKLNKRKAKIVQSAQKIKQEQKSTPKKPIKKSKTIKKPKKTAKSVKQIIQDDSPIF